MATTLTIPEMALHMRRLVEGMILDGHLRPAWAEGYEPVRVGDELGWLVPRGTWLNTVDPTEGVLPSDKIYAEHRSQRSCEPFDLRASCHLYLRRGFPQRWNPRAVREEYLVSEAAGWLPLTTAAVELACVAMDRRMGVHSDGRHVSAVEPGFDEVVVAKIPPGHTPYEFAGRVLADFLLAARVHLENVAVDVSTLVPLLGRSFFDSLVTRISEGGDYGPRSVRRIRWSGVDSKMRAKIQTWLRCSPSRHDYEFVARFLAHNGEGARERLKAVLAQMEDQKGDIEDVSPRDGRDGLEKIDGGKREIEFARLHFVEGKTQEDIAESFKVSQPTVCYRLQRAALRIREALAAS